MQPRQHSALPEQPRITRAKGGRAGRPTEQPGLKKDPNSEAMQGHSREFMGVVEVGGWGAGQVDGRLWDALPGTMSP